jgi:hypothetical protein
LLFAVLSALLIPTAFAQAPLIPSFTAGTGANESYMVLDFQDGTTQPSYLFGYKYDGSKTGLDMVEALDSAGSPLVGYVPGKGPKDGDQYGAAINSFSYDGHSQAGFENNAYWGYYTKNTGTWDYASTGFSFRTLSNGSYDGWSWSDGTDPLPRDPASPVPETSSAVLLSFGVAGLIFAAAVKRKRVS